MNTPQQQKLMRRASYASASVAVFLIAIKSAAYFMTESVAVLSSLVDSILDVLASLVNIVAVRHALVPADPEHRFGHGKAEALAGLAQGAFVIGSAALLLLEAGQRLYKPVPPEQPAVGVVVMVIAIVATALLVLYQRYVVKKTDSIAIKADSLHYLSDFLVNAGVIAALIISQFGWPLADPVIALMIAAFILYSAWRILGQSMDQLMDRELPDEDRIRIEALALSHGDVVDVHDIKTRMSGRTRFIQMHLELPAEFTLIRAHRITEEVQARLEEAFPGSEVFIHEDPAGIDEAH
jgi:ferrous-iron efflux pump FieF